MKYRKRKKTESKEIRQKKRERDFKRKRKIGIKREKEGERDIRVDLQRWGAAEIQPFVDISEPRILDVQEVLSNFIVSSLYDIDKTFWTHSMQ